MSRAVVGTAGHIDHGKTRLVHSLTGVDLDRSPEERARGITIDLGFVACPLPDGGRVALVDVPGHERLVRTIISGASGIDAVLLVVSAVEGAMPQTREHLDILGFLGVPTGAVVLSKVDLVDAELRELALEDVALTVRGTFLEGAPVVPFSAITGEGRDAVLAVLSTFPPRARPLRGPFRMPVDRTFVRPGFGTIASGTVATGTLTDGAAVVIEPDGHSARVRGLQVHGVPAEHVSAGQRAAINLAGAGELSRGASICQGPVAITSIVDVAYRGVGGTPPPDGASVRLLHGTSEVLGRLAAVGMLPDGSTSIQLRLDAPIACAAGDRVVVRRSSPMVTLGGGAIVDPWSVRLRPSRSARHAQELTRLFGGDPTPWLERAEPGGLPATDWAQRTDQPPPAILGDRVGTTAWRAACLATLAREVEAFHKRSPLARSAPPKEIQRGELLALGDRAFDALVELARDEGIVVGSGAGIARAGHQVSFSAADRARLEGLRRQFEAAGPLGLDAKEIGALELGGDVPALVRWLEAEGELLPVPGLGWVTPAARNRVIDAIRGHLRAHDTMPTGAFKDVTGLSRRGAIPWLEWLDRNRWTRRVEDHRVAGPALTY